MTLGPHVIKATPAALDWVRVAGIVKACNDPAPLESAPDSAVRLFRYVWGDGQQDYSKPGQAAATILGALKGYRHANLYVETFNEVGKGDRAAYIPFLKVIEPILHQAGIKVAGPSWATGDYEQEDWDAFRAAGWCGLDAIAVHGYSSVEVGPTEWNAFRWRRFYDPLLDGHLPVFVTEFGIGPVRDGPNGTYIGSNGWKAGNAPAERVVEVYLAYGRALLPHEKATVFSAGTTPDWDKFSVDELIPAILAGQPAITPPEVTVSDPTTKTYDVGTGVKAEMAKRGDTAESAENYKVDAKGQTYGSETYSRLGKYEWNKTSGEVYFFPKATG